MIKLNEQKKTSIPISMITVSLSLLMLC